ncbi:sensor histidine kinase [Brevibacillus panacihumi]|uniref:histidine kinase n=1 Tax=Brevibacillus panacihumi TaxID=497735 RepID=A0A3M8CTN5_9BACL|nr:sensor histidine kinase [Brevibacillus panacihumi]RNB78215.1 sensor histidine kinase [Brevibacillus panacihumi]
MQKWYQIFHKSTGLSPYVWVVFLILPFYFIFRSSSTYEVVFGICMILGFFICYVFSFLSKGWQMYFWTSLQIVISITMTLLFGYVYFALFLAFFIGNIQNKVGFFTLYTIHLISSVVSINMGFITKNSDIITQLPFVLVNLIAVILLPVTTYNRNKREQLEGQLEHANKRISELVKLEERQRIARDLHDTLGQKLSLIGLKSDLAAKLINKNPQQAQTELREIRQTARIALKEVREMVTEMRGTRLEDEILRIRQIFHAAQISFKLEGETNRTNISLIVENVVSMCLKEAVTNIIKHSQATECRIEIQPSRTELTVRVQDNGVGFTEETVYGKGNGLRGMRERLEFVNGTMEIIADEGTTLVIKVPSVLKKPEKEVGG